MVDLLENKRAAIAQACARFAVARLDVFGSALRDDFRPDKATWICSSSSAPCIHTISWMLTSASSMSSVGFWPSR